MKAAQQAAQSGKAGNKKTEDAAASADPPRGSDPPEAKATENNPYAKARRTAVPTAREIVCYECSTSLEVRGAMTHTVCHKCRTKLEIKDEIIDGDWSGELVTAGTVTVEKNARLADDSRITANNIMLRGPITSGVLIASRRITIDTEAPVDFSRLTTLDVEISKEIRLDLGSDVVRMRHVEVYGVLEACLKLSGLLCVRSSGSFSGECEGGRLKVEEGGGLDALVNIVGELS